MLVGECFSPMDPARRILETTLSSLPGGRAGRVHCQDCTAGGGSEAQGGRGGGVAAPGESDPRNLHHHGVHLGREHCKGLQLSCRSHHKLLEPLRILCKCLLY